MTPAERQATAAILRRLLDAVERGDLDAATPRGRALLTYLAGAAAALEADEAAEGTRRSAPPTETGDRRT